ncbi:MAG: hypothetical protein KatS3mg062_0439 [Tepidiforma sp.]|nr:MAG: hypothetical protein KatS3mg062_0439 [Tepidiforma sp.]
MTGRPAFERLAARALRLGLPPSLHPAQLAQAAVDAVLSGARAGEAPNRITVRLSPGDAGALAPISAEFQEALIETLGAACRAAGLRPFASWQLVLQPSTTTSPGEPAVLADFHDPASPAVPSTTRDTVRLRRLHGLRLRFADGRRAPLTHTPFLLGRGPDCDVVIPDLAVSRHHAEIRHRSDGGLELRDLGSRNGTFLNGERIAAAPLEPGDVLSLARVSLTLEAAE